MDVCFRPEADIQHDPNTTILNVCFQESGQWSIDSMHTEAFNYQSDGRADSISDGKS